MEEIDNGGDHRDHRLQRVARGATEPCLLVRRAPQPALPEQHETGRPSTQRPPSGTKQRITITLVGSTVRSAHQARNATVGCDAHRGIPCWRTINRRGNHPKRGSDGRAHRRRRPLMKPLAVIARSSGRRFDAASKPSSDKRMSKNTLVIRVSRRGASECASHRSTGGQAAGSHGLSRLGLPRLNCTS